MAQKETEENPRGWVHVARKRPDKDIISTLPIEIIRKIFQALMTIYKRSGFTEQDKAYLRGSKYLTHVSSKWRRIALDIPDLWWVSANLPLEVRTEFIKRTEKTGLLVKIIEDPGSSGLWGANHSDAGEQLTSFLVVMEQHFTNIRVLNAEVYTRDALHRILKLGRQAPMNTLRKVRLILSFDFYARMGAEHLNEREQRYGADLLDWKMPSIQSIQCRNVLPITSYRISEASLIVGSWCIIRISWISTPHLLNHIAHLSLALSDGGMLLTAPHGALPQTIFLPYLKRLSTVVRTGCDAASIHHPSVLNRLRVPALESLVIRFLSEVNTLNALTYVYDALSSAPRLRTLELLEANVRLEDFVDAALFPELESCSVRWTTLQDRFFNGADAHGEEWCNFPLSLRKIRFEKCKENSAYETVIPRLLRAFRDRFGENIQRGMVEISQDCQFLDDSRDILCGQLDEKVAPRLALTK